MIKGRNGSRPFAGVYPESTTIRELCESIVPKRRYRPNRIVGLQRPQETDQIPWYTDSIPAETTGGPTSYDVAALRINTHDPVVVFFSKVRNDGKLTTHFSTSESLPPPSHVAQAAHVHSDLSTSAHQSIVWHNTKLHAELGAFKADQLSPAHTTPNFPCIHVNDRLAISFHRTVRIPDDGGSYPAPKSLGALPLLNVSHFKDKLPTDAIEKGGLVTSLCGRCQPLHALLHVLVHVATKCRRLTYKRMKP